MRTLLTAVLAVALLLLSVLPSYAVRVIATFPAGGATGVDPTAVTAIWAQFNDTRMDARSFTGANASRFSIDNGASYSVSMVDNGGGDYARATLNAQLKYSTTYTVTINYRVRNTYGEQLGYSSSGNYVWRFTTMAKPPTDRTPPTVKATSPTIGAVNVPLNSAIGITFSEVMQPSTINTSTITVSGSVAGTVALDTTGTIATLTPGSRLASDTFYTVTVRTGVKDMAGNSLANQFSWSFRTLKADSAAPTVTRMKPVASATTVDIGATVSATFSEPMLASSLNGATFTVSGATGTVSYDSRSYTATYTPSIPLEYATNYTVTVGTGARDLAGNGLAAPKSWIFTTAAAAPIPPLNDYCQIPAYVTNATTAVKPNLLLLVDNSGSMYEFAYKSPGSGNQFPDTSYDPTATYYGYFESSQMYKYNSSSGGYFEPDPAPTVNTASFWSGNFLNWLTMRRIDIVRKALIGGKAKTRSANTSNFLIAAEDPDRDFYKSYDNVDYTIGAGSSTETITDTTHGTTYSVQVAIGNQPPRDGMVLSYLDRINFGIMFFNDGYRFEDDESSVRDGGYIAADIGTNSDDIVSKIQGTDPSTWTPVAESLYEATRYFAGIDSAYNGGTYSSKDPIQFRCQKNFVLILTDGESTKDRNLPGSSASMSGKVTDPTFNVKTWMDRIAAQEGSPSQHETVANTEDGTYYLEGVAYWAHVTDLRSPTLGKSELRGMQNLTIYTLFVFDDSPIGREILVKTAKYGGFVDDDSTGKPDQTDKWDKDHDGIPDTYFEAREGSLLTGALQEAFNQILARVASGTAASLLSNSEGYGANILQGVFYPKKYFQDHTSADWAGELHSLWFYVDPFIDNSSVREDTDYRPGGSDPAHYLDLAADRVVTFTYDPEKDKTLVMRYNDLKGDARYDVDLDNDGRTDSYTFVDQVDSQNLLSIWRAGSLLWSRTTPRTIYTQTSGTLTSFTALDTGSASNLKLLQAANKTEADKIVNYVSGIDQGGYRSRTVNIGNASGVWKLGDIVASTPRLQSSIRLNGYNLPPPVGYGDKSYGDDRLGTGFIYSSSYANRGMVYVGANDGMLHAFKLGTLSLLNSATRKASLTGSGLGQEMWAFVPKHALPYLRYLGDVNYNHIFFVDGNTVLNDVSIGRPASCTDTNYWNCQKDTVNGTNWRTVLISCLGLGGASKRNGSGCKGNSCVETPILDPGNTSKGIGYSSYFALDVTDPNSPSLLWEFGSPDLGFSTSGAAIVKISAKKGDGTPDPSKNGKWFAVLASGPTGPIDTTSHQFLGTSSQNLTLYVLNLADGSIAATIDTLADGSRLANAFAGSIITSGIDIDRWNPVAPGNYQDDALYFGYTQLSGNSWTGGGVLRLATGENPDPTTWKLSKVIDGVGPVTTNVARLQDRKNHNLWLYFGTGRYFYNLDDAGTQRIIAGVREPCYTANNTLDRNCSARVDFGSLTLQDSIQGPVNQGWYIHLDPRDNAANLGAERLITDPLALTTGAVFFTTFKPTADVCSYGGITSMWGVKFDTGGVPTALSLEGRALLQVSTGSLEQVDLPRSFTDKGGRKMGYSLVGKPPGEPPPIISRSSLRPVRKILHIQEH